MAAIGQSNNNYTTVQLARYVTAVANEGTVYQYTLLNRLEDSDGNVLQTFEPQVRNQIDVLDTEEWNAIHSGMRMVVENTKEFDGFPIEAAGKTGTAQQNLKRAEPRIICGICALRRSGNLDRDAYRIRLYLSQCGETRPECICLLL